jgi:ribonuclease MRP protein subunit RMP1
LIADNQYSALGLMLLATLASFNRIIAPYKKSSPPKKPESKASQVELDASAATGEDIGEKISRKGDSKVEENGAEVIGKIEEPILKSKERKKLKALKRTLSESKSTATQLTEMETSPKPPKKKKKKKANAIDDLFSGLL